MWQNFYTSKNNLENVIASFNRIKQDIFEVESIKVKEYFAQKVVLAFDNLMIFHSKIGLKENLLSAISDSQMEMNNAVPLFLPIRLYLLKEKIGYSLMIKNINYSNNIVGIANASNFKYIGQEDGIVENFVKFENNSISTLAFDLSLVNYSRSWINFVPSLEERARFQADHILFLMTFKKVESSMNERLIFLENVRKHPNYQELYNKIIRLMPKLESSLEKQWRLSSIMKKNLNIDSITSK